MIRSRMRRSSGFTLTELLVTVGISLALIAAVLPIVKFNLDEGKVREAARQVQAFLAKAKAQAALNGRVAGVWIDRDQNDPSRATNLYLAEVPPPFGGAVTTSRVIASGTPLTLQFVYDDGTATPKADTSTTGILDSVLDVGDRFGIRFDYKGPIYVGDVKDAAGVLTFELDPASPAPPNGNNKGYPYQLFFPPQKIATQHLELPVGTFLSLENSGLGGSGTELATAGTQPEVVITFSEGGSFTRLYTGGADAPPTASLHLLVSRLRNDNEPDPEDRTQPLRPVNDPTNLWVSIGATSGAIRTADNAPDMTDPVAISAAPDRMTYARQFAIGHDIRGGR